jgi:mono/diheme cytochrome c family protein
MGALIARLRYRARLPGAAGYFLSVGLLLGLLAACPPESRALDAAAGVETDPGSGLIIDAGWELVRGHCVACHSARLVTQNRGSRETWLSMIRWMQETQGLWQFDQATENTILDYLARNYGPADVYRRSPLAPEFLPANPYAKKTPSK